MKSRDQADPIRVFHDCPKFLSDLFSFEFGDKANSRYFIKITLLKFIFMTIQHVGHESYDMARPTRIKCHILQ